MVRRRFYDTPRKTNPLHWLAVMVVSSVCISWMLIDTSPSVEYKPSAKYQSAAIKSLHLDDTYRLKMQKTALTMKTYCDNGLHIVFAHNVRLKGEILEDHMFHVCGGRTWINARIVDSSSPTKIRCQEEYANVFQSKMRSKDVKMRAIDVETWSEQEVESYDTMACKWAHAVDILENTCL